MCTVAAGGPGYNTIPADQTCDFAGTAINDHAPKLTRGSDTQHRSRAAISWSFGAGATKLRTRNDLDPVGGGAPPTLNLVDFLGQHGGFLHHRRTRDINMPKLTYLGLAHHIKAGQVTAMGTAKA